MATCGYLPTEANINRGQIRLPFQQHLRHAFSQKYDHGLFH